MTWIEVMLAFAGVALICVTILIAVAAFVGFDILKKYVHTIVQQNALQSAESQIKKFLADKAGNIKKMIVEEVKKQGETATSEYRRKKLSEEQNRIIDKFQESLPDKPVNITKLAEEFGLEVWHATLPPKISGMIVKENGGYAIYANGKEPKARRHFTYAHELAHYLLHKEHIGNGLQDNILFRSALSNKQEVEANKLAADILMPMDAIDKMVEKGTHNLQELADKFGVSRNAMLIRLGIPDLE